MSDYPEITFRIKQAFQQLEVDKITPWAFLGTGKMRPIEDFHGRTIHYSGVAFEGSPRQVFWNGFIEPFLEALFLWAFDLALAYAKGRHLDARSVLQHARQCLSNGIYSIYRRMQDIDRRLKGKGFPERASQHDISRPVEFMHAKLEGYFGSALRAAAEKANTPEPPPLSDALELKPGISGISVDLKQVWQWGKGKLKGKSPTS